MGNNLTNQSEDSSSPVVMFNSSPVSPKIIQQNSADDILDNFEEDSPYFQDDFPLDKKVSSADGAARIKRKSKRVKKAQDYFQWDSFTQKQQDMYFDFVKTAKKTWANREYDDEDVEKVVLNKIALLRFCIARDFIHEKAFNMWIKWVEWRIDYQPHKIRRKNIKDSTFNKCFFIWEDNKIGCPCIVISPGASSETYDTETCWKVATYVMEKACKKADKNGSTQICVIFDRTNMNNKTEKKWLPIYKEMATLIQDYYPERLNKAYVLHMNWFAKMMYSICKAFIAKKTRNKVRTLFNH